MKSEEITKALQWRYAVKTFDTEKKVSDADLKAILESARLAPSGVGLEPWKFIVVKDPAVRAKLRAAAFDQTKVTDASDLIVITYRTDADKLPMELIERTAVAQSKTHEELDGLKQMAIQASGGNLRAHAYIPFGMMMETAALLGIDTGPMEGFDPAQVDEILGLKERNLASTAMLAVGYRGDDLFATFPKTRRAYDDVIEVI